MLSIACVVFVSVASWLVRPECSVAVQKEPAQVSQSRSSELLALSEVLGTFTDPELVKEKLELALSFDDNNSGLNAGIELSVRSRVVSLHRRRGEFVEALAYCPRVRATLSHLEAIDGIDLEHEYFRDVIARAYGSFAQLDLELGRVELAGRGLSEARRKLGGSQFPESYTFIANQYRLRTGRFDLVDSGTGESPHLIRHALLGKLFSALSSSKEAAEVTEVLEASMQYIEANDNGPGSSLIVASLAARLAARSRIDTEEFAKSVETFAAALAEQSPQLAYLADAYEALVSAALLEGSEESERRAVEEKLESAWRELLDIWEASPPLNGGTGFLGDMDRRDLFATTLNVMRQNDHERAAFDLLQETRCLGSIERSLDVIPPDLDECVALLSEHEAGVLELVPGLTTTLVCALDKRGLRWFELEPLAPHVEKIVALSDALDAIDAELVSDEAVAKLSSLAGELGPIFLRDDLVSWIAPWTHVLIAGRDLCYDVDIEALPLGNGAALGLERSVAGVSSTALMMMLSGRAKSLNESGLRAEQLVVCATGIGYESLLTGRLAALPCPEWLPDALAPQGVERLIGEEATFAALAGRPAGPRDRWTLFGHGANDVSRPVPSGILLASSGKGESGRIAWWNELAQLRAAGTCALLTCKGSFGFARPGDGGYAKLTGALLVAGAHTVLASPRDLEAADAVRLHGSWLANLSKPGKLTPGEALAIAKASLVVEDDSQERWACLLRLLGLPWAPL